MGKWLGLRRLAARELMYLKMYNLLVPEPETRTRDPRPRVVPATRGV